ncbi:hypothetical protein B0H63DRAFT_478237 [Podospora didyma]|uniref:Tetratricopeptide SHNi-TPR domain-containing protein n=1 Tax=Podospora didyma TaxID=330526 RepID=A0AAE0NC39_9PEZI|nr:hypothetical protein B0H63DRAFT_478237 [Podospora didyma]
MATPAATTGASTPALELDPEQAAQSLKVSLADLSAKATALYAHKNYEEAAEVYAQAAEMQAEMNGEMSTDNAEILFLYGRALFKVGQSKSDVLGGKAPDTKKSAGKPKPKAAANGKAKAENGASSSATEDKAEDKKEEPSVESKPMFHFEGDENFDESDEDEDAEEGGEGEGEDDDEDDDLAMAFEILDLARVLFTKKLEEAPKADAEESGKAQDERDKQGDAEPINKDSPTVRHIKERLADTHDLLAEISLENERYPNAITDSRASLAYKKELYPEESEIIAEAHFKLSLALEFASVTKSEDEDDKTKDSTMDQGLRDEAGAELEAAISSTKLKLQSKELELATMHNPEDNDVTREQIQDVREVIADMEQRLVELKKPPIDINAALGLPTSQQKTQPEAALPEEVTKNAKDLTGLVRKKRKAEDKPTDEVEAKKVKEDESVN